MLKPGSRFRPVEPGGQFHPDWSAVAVVLAICTASLTVLRYWYFSAPYPPGLDGAQWLSYGRALFAGTGRSAESTYAPLIPFLAFVLSLSVGPMVALRSLAVV